MKKDQRKQMEEGNAKLIQLANLLESRKTLSRRIDLKKYDQNQFYHECGSPGCALGLWAFMNQDTWVINVFHVSSGTARLPVSKEVLSEEKYRPANLYSTSMCMESAMREFCLNRQEAESIFGGEGCASAKNEMEAAAFIRNFVMERASYLEVHRIYGGGSEAFVPDQTE